MGKEFKKTRRILFEQIDNISKEIKSILKREPNSTYGAEIWNSWNKKKTAIGQTKDRISITEDRTIEIIQSTAERKMNARK